jgi:pyruvate/2-oxoglutarate dehydrogenase complex dihydrolipoamide dehydrogenase (E3) component
MRVLDVVVLGGGPAGEEAAARLADRGLEVVLVEDRPIRGECAHWACLPSNALLRPYEALGEARRIRGAREAVNGGTADDADLMTWVATDRITLVRGRGQLTGERRVMVGDATTAEQIPGRMVIVGGGPVGVEMAQAFQTLGSLVQAGV